jgi:hypothetical protein
MSIASLWLMSSMRWIVVVSCVILRDILIVSTVSFIIKFAYTLYVICCMFVWGKIKDWCKGKPKMFGYQFENSLLKFHIFWKFWYGLKFLVVNFRIYWFPSPLRFLHQQNFFWIFFGTSLKIPYQNSISFENFAMDWNFLVLNSGFIGFLHQLVSFTSKISFEFSLVPVWKFPTKVPYLLKILIWFEIFGSKF